MSLEYYPLDRQTCLIDLASCKFVGHHVCVMCMFNVAGRAAAAELLCRKLLMATISSSSSPECRVQFCMTLSNLHVTKAALTVICPAYRNLSIVFPYVC